MQNPERERLEYLKRQLEEHYRHELDLIYEVLQLPDDAIHEILGWFATNPTYQGLKEVVDGIRQRGGDKKLTNLFVHECMRCGYEWPSRREKPRRCAKCHSLLWQVPKKEEFMPNPNQKTISLRREEYYKLQEIKGIYECDLGRKLDWSDFFFRLGLGYLVGRGLFINKNIHS